MLKKLLEKIFHRQELKKLREDNKQLIHDNQVFIEMLKGENLPFNIFEKKMMLDCLVSPGYKEKVSNPATKRFIRNVYRTLKAKLVEAARG